MRKELFPDTRDDIFVIHDFLSPEECERYIARTEAAGYDDAPISTLGGPVMFKELRNNDRVMIDDVKLAADLWERAKPFIPTRTQFWVPVGLNERFRFYRYDPGQQFNWHFDGCFERRPGEQSTLTFMVYLSGGCEGGATEFNLRSSGGVQNDDPVLQVRPEAGKALIFTHRVLHRGAPVTAGRKYVLRTDVMSRWASAT